MRDRVLAMISGYLQDWEGVGFDRLDDGRFMLRTGSAAVYVDCIDIGTTSVVTISAPILTGINKRAPLERLASMNANATFGKFSYYEDGSVVAVEWELLGDTLDASDLYTGIDAVGSLADEWDDVLQKDFGGELHPVQADDQDERDV